MTEDAFQEFRTRKLGEGYDEVIVREWAAGFANEPHAHPFDADVAVVQGEFWLTMDGQTSHLRAGDTFKVGRGVTHSETYGSQGAVFWAARRN